MSVYRITRFAASDMDKVGGFVDNYRNELAGVGANFIDLVSYGNGTGVVIAKYPDRATMEAASDFAKQIFGEMIEGGAVDSDSIQPQTGEVFKSV